MQEFNSAADQLANEAVLLPGISISHLDNETKNVIGQKIMHSSSIFINLLSVAFVILGCLHYICGQSVQIYKFINIFHYCRDEVCELI